MAMTIKQLADELGVSKTAIRKKMTEEFRAKYVETTANGVLLVSDEGANLLKSLQKPVETTANQLPETAETEFPHDTIEWYRKQIRKKDEQIDYLMKDNKELTTQLLDLSKQVGASLQTISQGHLADKLIEGKKLLDEEAVTVDDEEDIRDKGFFAKLAWAFTSKK